MKFLVFNDPHFTSVGPSSRIDNYEETCFRKLDEIFSLFRTNNCDYAICTGDMFHCKPWNKNPYKLVAKLSDALRVLGDSLYVLPGNHDIINMDPSSVYDQPLGVLARAANFSIMSSGNVDLGNGIFITASPSNRFYDSRLDDYLPDRPSNCSFLIHVTHGALLPSAPVYTPFTLYSDLIACQADVLLNGHIHSNLGIKKIGMTSICNTGAITRGSISEDDVTRHPSILLFETNPLKFDVVELKSAVPASVCFDLSKLREKKQAEEEISKLGELIKKETGEVELGSNESIRQAVKESTHLSPKVRDTVYRLLDTAEAECAKG